MHIPDGTISPSTAVVGYAAVAPFWYIASRKASKELKSAAVPRLGLYAAFSFVLMMFNVQLPGGTSGHAVGGALAAIALGPWQAVLAVSAALAIQAVFFADGGILALGLNCLIMAVALPFSAWYAFRLLRKGRLPDLPAAVVAGWFGLMIGALLVAVALGIQPALFRAEDGTALYFPFGLALALPAMLIPHALVAAPIEGLVTALVYGFLVRSQSGLVKDQPVQEGRMKLWPAWIGLLLMILLTPVGLLAQGTAWGEWGSEELEKLAGYLPKGFAAGQLESPTHMAPDYVIPGLPDVPGYVVSAVVGVICVLALVWVLAIAMRERKPVQGDS